MFAAGLATGVVTRGAWHELIGRRVRVDISRVCLRHEPSERFVVTGWFPVAKVLR